MKRVHVSTRAGNKERGVVRLRQGDSAIVFTTSGGQKIEVDLAETSAGNLLIRAHDGAAVVTPNQDTLEVTTRG